jgi:hypothetical protein
MWAVPLTLTAPVANDAAWIDGTLSSTGYCSWESALSANKAYGVQMLVGTAGSASAGVHAPVALSTWNTDTGGVSTDKGPRIDGNPVFDSVVVIIDSVGTFEIAATLPTVVAPETVN